MEHTLAKSKIIFYGAGRQAQYLFSGSINTYNRFPIPDLKDGVCFADADERKYASLFLGLPVMSIAQALEQFPDANIYVSLAFPAKYAVFGYLTEQLHIPAERILNFEPVEKYASCEYLQGYLLIQNNGLGFCFNNFGRNFPPNVSVDRAPEHSVPEFLKVRSSLIQDVRSGKEGSACFGCRNIQTQYWPKRDGIRHLYIDDYSGCNIHCSYCTVSKPLSTAVKPSATFSYLAFIHYLEQNGLVDEDFRCDVLPGEITVHPYREEILQSVSAYPNVFFTNAILFHPKIAQILDRGLSYIYVSMDAGTAETFQTIKGLDAFERVCENLRAYAKHGAVELKYIVLPGINDNATDAKGFVALCKDLKVQNVIISRNYHGWKDIDDHQLAFTTDLYIALIKEKIPVSIPNWQYSATENQQITAAIEKQGYQRH